MEYIYKDSDRPLEDWRELVPVYIPKFEKTTNWYTSRVILSSNIL